MEINITNLTSREARKTATGGSGIRRFAVSGYGKLTKDDGGFLGGILSPIYKFASSLIGVIAKTLFKGISITWSTLWGLFCRAKAFIWNFNWNAPDEELDKAVKERFDAFGGILGSTLGTIAGQLLGGVVPGLILFRFNVPLAIYVLENSGEEVLEEIGASVSVMIQSLVSLASQTLFTYLYKNIRRKLTGGIRARDEALLAEMEKSGKVTADKAAQIRAKRDEPWSFALATEKAIDSLPSQFAKNFAENFSEEFGENFDEAGMVVANSIDEYSALQKISPPPNPMGQERTVEILLNRSTDDTRTIA